MRGMFVGLLVTAVVGAGAIVGPVQARSVAQASDHIATGAGGTTGSGGGVLGSATCRSARNILNGVRVDRSRLNAGSVSLNGWRVDHARSWRAHHPSNNSLTLRFHSAAWMLPDSHEGIDDAVALFLQQATSNPDPGSGGAKSELLPRGWNEAAVTLRLRTLSCLYAVADDDQRRALDPALDALVQAALDPRRYYGPPVRKPHNHGVMADRALLVIARVTGDTQLAVRAQDRLELQLQGMYDSCGLQREQSNGYQYLHESLWRQVGARVTDPALRSRISKALTRIRVAAQHLTWPDGVMPRIGDGLSRRVDPSLVRGDVRLVCPQTGWFSWRSTGRGVVQQVIARFGPPTALHGHADKGSVLWWVQGRGAGGVPVLADRGLPGKYRNAEYEYAVGPAGHSVLLWPGGSDIRMSAQSEVNRAGGDLRLVGVNRGLSWARTVDMAAGRASLRITDQTNAAGTVTQNLPLDPLWTSTSQPGVFDSPGGERLRIQCSDATGRTITPTRARVMDYQQPEPRRAWTVRCATSSGEVDTVLTVSAR